MNICSYYITNFDNVSNIVIEKIKTSAAIFIQRKYFATDAITKRIIDSTRKKGFAAVAVRYRYIATVILNFVNTLY